MLASRWRDHQGFLPPAGDVKDNVSALELTVILHANPKPQELRAFFAKIAIEKWNMESIAKIAIGNKSIAKIAIEK